jgi:hypothetical protein
MSMSAPRQVAATWAALLALAAIVDLATGHDAPHAPDDASFRAGYAAVSSPVHARTLMALSGTDSSSLCVALLDNRPVSTDFVSGCKHAIANAME